MERLLRDEEERRADGGHEEGWDECDPVRLLVAHEVDGNRPEREDAERLIREAEVLPDGIETVRVLHKNKRQQKGSSDNILFASFLIMDYCYWYFT